MTYPNPKKRLVIMLAVFALIFLALCAKLFYWQVIKSAWLQERAIGQWTQGTVIAAKRGKILDTSGLVLAQSGGADTVVVNPKAIEQSNREKVARSLSEILYLDYQETLKKISQTNLSQVYIKRLVSPEQATAIRLQNMSGVDFAIETKRYYPMKDLASQVIGYTNIDSDGQEGLEATLQKYLAGTDGKIVSEKDNANREMPNGAEQHVPAEDGCNVVLTIDAVIQTFLEKAINEAFAVNNAVNVQGIVMNPKTGEVLAMANKPGIDLNNPPRDNPDLLRASSRNRVIADSYEPGSTFKIITLAAGLEEKVISTSSSFHCMGYSIVDGQRIKCWRTFPHGTETLEEGVQNSCNPVFMDIALRLGKEKFYESITDFGFGSLTGIELTGESTGIVRHQKYVKTVDLARIGFGQSIAVTPISLATGVSAAINGGKLMKPYIVKEIVSPTGTVVMQSEPTVVREVISEETSKLVAQLLEGVVAVGSGKAAYIPGMRVGGKTGTAQKYEDGGIAQGKYVASFLGFAPAEDPQVLCLILVDEPKISAQVFGSTVAAPYVRSVLYDSLKHLGVKPVYSEEEKGMKMDVVIPDVRNLLLEDAKKALGDLKLNVTADGEAGSIVSQIPLPNSVVPEGTGVLLYTTEPTQEPVINNTSVVPDLTGKKLKQAYYIINEMGLTCTSTGPPLERVIAQIPLPGTTTMDGANIELIMGDPENPDLPIDAQGNIIPPTGNTEGETAQSQTPPENTTE